MTSMGKKQYDNLRMKIHSIWKTQYRLYKQPNDGNCLINQTYLRIEDLDSSTLGSSISDFNLLSLSYISLLMIRN